MFVSLWCVLELSVNRGGVECVLWLRLQMNETASTAYVSCNEYLENLSKRWDPRSSDCVGQRSTVLFQGTFRVGALGASRRGS